MKSVFSILLFCLVLELNAQTAWSTREYRIPGLSQQSMDLGLRYSGVNDSGDTNLRSLMFSSSWGKSVNDFWETQFTFGLGGTDYYNNNKLSNYDLGWDMVLKYEEVALSGSKFVPFARGGITLNLLADPRHSNTSVSKYRKDLPSGQTYLDYYANYSAGIAYVAPHQKWALSTEWGSYHWLTGDLDLGDYTESFWSTHLYYGAFKESGIKLMYSYELDSEMSTYGVYWHKNY